MTFGKNLSSPSDSHKRTTLATAGWYDPAALSDQFDYREDMFWLGRTLDGQNNPLGYDDDRHVCLVAGTRGGKGASIIVNNLCQWPGSCIVLDPKGENAAVTARRRGQGSDYAEGMGQSVHVLDPFNIVDLPGEYKSSFNPLDVLDPESGEVVDEAARLADAMIITGQSKEPFWEESARELVKGIILHVITNERFSKDLITVRKLITGGDWETYDIMEAAGDEDIPSSHKLLLEDMSRNKALGGVIRGIGTTFLNSSIESPRTFQSVLQTAVTQTEFLDSEGLRSSLVTSDFKLSDLKTDPKGVSIYLALPQRYMNTHFRWFRMMVTLTITEMEKISGQPACGHRVLMIMDEFAGLKRMEIIENAVAQMAGFGVKLFYIAQTLPQLKSIYQDNWETLIANAGLKIFFDLEDHFSRDYVSKLIGETEIIRELKSSSRTKGRSENYSEGESQSHTKSKSTGSSTSGSTTTSRGSSSGGGQGGGHYSSSSGTSHTVSHSTSHTEGESDTHGTSKTRGHGTSDSETRGMSQNLQKTLLITPDEIGRMFARIDDEESDYYPGLALIMTTGQPPFPVRRCNYFEDVEFIGCFDPHPDHDTPRMLYQTIDIGTPDQGFIDSITDSRYGPVLMNSWEIQEGDHIALPQFLGRIGPCRDLNETKPDGGMREPLYAPVSGIVTDIYTPEKSPLSPGKSILSIRANWRQTYIDEKVRGFMKTTKAEEFFREFDATEECWGSVYIYERSLRAAERDLQERINARNAQRKAQEEEDKKVRRQKMIKMIRYAIIAVIAIVIIYFGYRFVSNNTEDVIEFVSVVGIFIVLGLIYYWIRGNLR